MGGLGLPGLLIPEFMALPASLQNLIDQFKRLPGVGAKSAQRLAFHVLKTPREEAERLCDAIRDVKDRVTYCSICNNITDADPCAVLRRRLARPQGDLRRRRTAERARRRKAGRVPRRLSRAARRAVAAAGRRSGRSQDQGPAHAHRSAAASKRSSSRPIPPSKARRRRSTWRACSSRSACASRASRPAFLSAAISNTPTS